MPLPEADAPWPPEGWDRIEVKQREWSAWLSGEPADLAKFYGPTRAGVGQARPALSAGTFWGQEIEAGDDPFRVHVPIARDLCQASADLLYADPPTISVAVPEGQTDQAAADAIAGYIERGLFTVLAAAAEIGAGLGDAYLAFTRDPDIGTVAYRIDADAAYPTFDPIGRLESLTVAQVTRSKGSEVDRHVQVFERDYLGGGIIRHGWYRGTSFGTSKALGSRLTIPDGAARELGGAIVGNEVVVSVGAVMPAVHIPNLTPQLTWRRHPVGAYLGRSDLGGGVESLMDQLDAAFSAWLRDVDLAKGRLLVGDYMLDQGQPGQGQTFNGNRRLFTPLAGVAPSDTGDLEASVKMTQFRANVDEHSRTCQEITETIIRSTGHSAGTYGEDEDGAAQTATGVIAKDKRTVRTRDRKITHHKRGVAALITAMLTFDGLPGRTVLVDFPEASQEAPVTLAATVQAFRAADAISMRTGIEMGHPDWDATRVDRELADIRADLAGGALADPLALGGETDTTIPVMPADELTERAAVYSQLWRSGISAEAAARIAGLPANGGDFTGAVSVATRLPAQEAAGLEEA